MAVEWKVEDGKVLVSAALESGIDADKDGKKSVEVSNVTNLKLDGMEIVDELAKSSDFLAKLKEKFGG